MWLNLSGDFLVTFCWSGFCAWGDSMCFYEFKLVTWVASAENTWTTFSSDCSYIFCPGIYWYFFFLVLFFPRFPVWLSVCSENLIKVSKLMLYFVKPSMLVFFRNYNLLSKMWCFRFILSNWDSAQKCFACFLLFSSHPRIYHLHLSVFYSLCKNWAI